MKQLFQNLRSGESQLVELPIPQVEPGYVLIQTHRSLISLGTERMLVEFSKGSLLTKARQQPERVKQVIDKIKTDGLKSTLNSVFSKLDEPMPLGYCNAGTVLAVGEGILDLKPGDRVASNGPHAEVVCVLRNLVAKIPDNVTFDEAAFTVIGSIGLQGVRLAMPTLGETIVIIGLGLVGQITAQLARTNGCKVIGIDVDPHKAALLNTFSCTGLAVSKETDTIAAVLELTNGIGADAVLITASAKDDSIVSQAARMCRKRGRIVLVGVVDLHLDRTEFYQKELSFQVSCSYGPGRYDSHYEEKGIDYPLPFVRWTENRNFETILSCIALKQLDVKSLISETVEFDNAVATYTKLGQTDAIATILSYNNTINQASTIVISTSQGIPTDSPTVAVIGSGNYTGITMMPLLVKSGLTIKYMCSQKGASSTHLAKKFKVPFSTTDYDTVLADKDINAVIITTRHNLHAPMILSALKAKKNIFVEKPLALNRTELNSIITEYSASKQSIMVGFNRRFSPYITKAKELIAADTIPINVIITVNAGCIPSNHWTQDAAIGGGRIIGEACHFIDLFSFLSGSPIVSVCASSLGSACDTMSDNVMILLKAANGSQASINYLSNGSKKYSKEDIKIFAQGKVLHIDNFRKMTGYGFKHFSFQKSSQQLKGHAEEFKIFAEAIKKGLTVPIPFAEIVNVTEASIAVLESLQKNSWITFK
jgi:predicted dehydrogenase/threonine dehydrogenase-like Zn-dependent dehydrogenase